MITKTIKYYWLLCLVVVCACNKPLTKQEAITFYTKHFESKKMYYNEIFNLLNDTCLTKYNKVIFSYAPGRKLKLNLCINEKTPLVPLAEVCSMEKNEKITRLWEKINVLIDENNLQCIYFFPKVFYFEMNERNLHEVYFVICKSVYPYETYDTTMHRQNNWYYFLGDGFYLWSPPSPPSIDTTHPMYQIRPKPKPKQKPCYYKIQIGVFSSPKDSLLKNKYKHTPIERVYMNGKHHYFIGVKLYTDYEAIMHRNAFLIMYKPKEKEKPIIKEFDIQDNMLN